MRPGAGGDGRPPGRLLTGPGEAAPAEIGPRSPGVVPPPQPSRVLGALRHRPFRMLWLGALASNTGTWLTNLTVPYVLFQLTSSPVWVGMASAAQFVPQVLLSPLGGTLADRHDRRRLLVWTQAGLALAATLLWVTWVAGTREPWLIAGAVAVTGALTGVNLPSWQAFVNDLVPRDDLVSAVALNSLQFNASRAIGPAIAGGVLASLGPAWAFFLDVLSFAFVIVALAAVRGHVATRRASRPVRTGVAREFGDAVRYMRAQPGVKAAILASVFIGFLGNPIFGFTVVFSQDVFGTGAVALGFMNATLGLGALAATPLVAGSRLSRRLLIAWSLPAYGAAQTCFGLSPGTATACVALFVAGGALLVCVATANTATQVIVADRFRARVLAARIMLMAVCFAAGGLVQGWIAEVAGPRETVTGAGLLILLAGIAILGWRRGGLLAHVDDRQEQPAA